MSVKKFRLQFYVEEIIYHVSADQYSDDISKGCI